MNGTPNLDRPGVVRILCQNVNHSFAHIDVLLEYNKDVFDIVFLQELLEMTP